MTEEYIINGDQFKKVMIELLNIKENYDQKNEICKVFFEIVKTRVKRND